VPRAWELDRRQRSRPRRVRRTEQLQPAVRKLCHEAVKATREVRPARQPAGNAPLIKSGMQAMLPSGMPCNHDSGRPSAEREGISEPISTRASTRRPCGPAADRPGKFIGGMHAAADQQRVLTSGCGNEGRPNRPSVLIFSPALRAASACRPVDHHLVENLDPPRCGSARMIESGRRIGIASQVRCTKLPVRMRGAFRRPRHADELVLRRTRLLAGRAHLREKCPAFLLGPCAASLLSCAAARADHIGNTAMAHRYAVAHWSLRSPMASSATSEHLDPAFMGCGCNDVASGARQRQPSGSGELSKIPIRIRRSACPNALLLESATSHHVNALEPGRECV